MTSRPADARAELIASLQRRRQASEIALAIIRQPAGLLGIALTLFFILLAVLAPVIAPFSPLETHVIDALSEPNATYLLGSDELGRDVLSRLLYGARPTIIVAFLGSVGGGLAGAAAGIAAGYYRGAIEVALMRICDALFAFPLIMIGICTVVLLGAGQLQVGLALGIGVAPTFARLARAEVLKEMQRDFILASRGMGAGDGWIVFRHLLPNISTSLIVQLAAAASTSTILASALDFLGLGTQPPGPSWGNMLQASRLHLAEAPLYALAPGILLTAFVVAINLLAAALTIALNPRTRTGILHEPR